MSLWAASLFGWAYGITDRTQFSLWMPFWLLSSAVYLFLGWKGEESKISPAFFVLLALAVLPVMPYFSDDYFRFYWDGYLFYKGQSVYAATPQQIALLQQLPKHLQDVFTQLNSQGYYAIYTPVNQFLYAIPFAFGIHSIVGFVVVLRCVFLGMGLAGYFGLRRALQHMQINPHRAWWLLGNPLLWMEGLINLHVEWVIVFLILTSLPLLLRQKALGFASVTMALALKISTLPVFMGLLLPRYSKKSLWLLLGSAMAVVGISMCCIPVREIPNLLESLRLFTANFEFNGLLYPVVNGIVSNLLGYNAIAFTGTALSVIAFTVLLSLWAYMKQQKITVFLVIKYIQWSCLIYLFCATTIHPWYLLLPLATLPFVPNRFLLAWSLTVFLSYWFYQDYRIQPWWWLLEYGIPGLYAIYPKIAYALGWNSCMVARR